MPQIRTLWVAATHQLYAGLRAASGGVGRSDPDDIADEDRGAVTLEQVLWFVAAGVSVAVIAAILWSQIKDKADDPVTPPVAP